MSFMPHLECMQVFTHGVLSCAELSHPYSPSPSLFAGHVQMGSCTCKQRHISSPSTCHGLSAFFLFQNAHAQVRSSKVVQEFLPT